MSGAGPCESCGEGAPPGTSFCEACGARIPAGGSPAPADPRPSCHRCGGPFAGDGYCQVCGVRSLVAADRVEIDLGPVAAVSDRGRRHPRNEDAVAVVLEGDRAAAVVCDGVSSTDNPAGASAAASAAAIAVLASALTMPPPRDGAAACAAVAGAIGAARRAAAAVPGGAGEPPSTTLVAVLVGPGLLTVGHLGDSRAYWLATERSAQLTVDDSWAEEAISNGMPPAVAHASPQAHTITRWLGSDGDTAPATIGTFPVEFPGTVLVCSDGLWTYFPAADDLASLVAAGRPHGALAAARGCVDAALAAGGRDNVTAAIIFTAPEGTPAGPSHSWGESACRP